MHTTGMSFKVIGRQMGYQYAVASRLVRKHTQTNNVKMNTFFETPDLNTQIRSVNILNFE
jgi:hypothetical protein